MPTNRVLDFNVSQNAWEPRSHWDGDGELLTWHVAAVRDGGSEAHAVYQAAATGVIHQAETGDDDAGEPIRFLTLGKRVDCGAVARAHNLYFRFEGVPADSLTVTVTMGGAEYGEVSRGYTLDLAGTDDTEVRIRLHRTLMGRWLQVQLGGDVSNRPAIREILARVVPIRSGRLTV